MVVKLKISEIFINVRYLMLLEMLALVDYVTVTSKGQITIPSRLRRELKIMKGEKLLIIREGNAIKMIPMPKLSRLAGVDEEVFKGRRPSEEIEIVREEWTREFEKRVR
jgi:AbrB family looped-hinge helix DNA binding protein